MLLVAGCTLKINFDLTKSSQHERLHTYMQKIKNKKYQHNYFGVGPQWCQMRNLALSTVLAEHILSHKAQIDAL